MFLLKLILTILPFQNEFIPQGIEVWDHRGPETALEIETLAGEKAFLIAALPDSYENQILSEIGYEGKTFSVDEWKDAVKAKGYRITHSEIRHELACFDSPADIREWLQSTLSTNQISQFLWVMENRGWIDLGNGKIGFPYKRLILIIEKVDQYRSKEQLPVDPVRDREY